MNTRDVIVGAALGGALAFLTDPNQGRRRRALARDQFVRASRKTRDALDATARDMSNRTRGVAAAARSRSDTIDDDERLVERVRAKVGRVCSHPRALEITAKNGEVTLKGPILASEVEEVRKTAETVRGVRSFISQLEPHASAEGVPSLQGRSSVAGPSLDILQRNWATRALVAVGLAATGLCVAAYARR
jgi:gas vesicle protein